MANVELIKKIFTKIDSNGDGAIEEAELVNVFKKFDKDGEKI